MSQMIYLYMINDGQVGDLFICNTSTQMLTIRLGKTDSIEVSLGLILKHYEAPVLLHYYDIISK